MRREAAGTSAALQSMAEPIAAARGGAGAPAENRPAPSQHSWLLEELAGGEESRARSSSGCLPWQHRWSSSAVLGASAQPAAQRYGPIAASLRIACCLNLLIRVGGKFTGRSELFDNSVCGRAVGGDLLRWLGSAARCGKAAGAVLVPQALLRRGSLCLGA